MIVLDASVALELVLKTDRSIRWADLVFENELHTPHLIDVETLHVLRRMALARMITEREAEEAIQELQDMPLFRHPHWPLLSDIWDLRQSLTGYDASYVALAGALDIPLFTCDAKLSRSHGHVVKIVLLE